MKFIVALAKRRLMEGICVTRRVQSSSPIFQYTKGRINSVLVLAGHLFRLFDGLRECGIQAYREKVVVENNSDNTLSHLITTANR